MKAYFLVLPSCQQKILFLPLECKLFATGFEGKKWESGPKVPNFDTLVIGDWGEEVVSQGVEFECRNEQGVRFQGLQGVAVFRADVPNPANYYGGTWLARFRSRSGSSPVSRPKRSRSSLEGKNWQIPVFYSRRRFLCSGLCCQKLWSQPWTNRCYLWYRCEFFIRELAGH